MRKLIFKLVKKLFAKEMHTDRDTFLRENFTYVSFLDLRDGIPYGAAEKTQSVLVEEAHIDLLRAWGAQLLDVKEEACKLRSILIIERRERGAAEAVFRQEISDSYGREAKLLRVLQGAGISREDH